MKKQVAIGVITLLAGSLFAADAQDEVKNAAKKLAGTGAYAWKSTIEMGGGGGGGGGRGGFRAGPTEGRIGKDGMAMLTMTRGENTIEAVVIGTKGAVKTDEGWQSLAEAAEGGGGGQPNPGRFTARRLQNFKAPAAEAEELAGKVKELTKSGEAFSGALTEEAAQGLMTFGGGRGGGGGGPTVSNAKGSVKFWVKDGVLVKYEYQVQGTMSFGGNERELDRTTTVEIKDIGTAKVEIPEDAKKKL